MDQIVHHSNALSMALGKFIRFIAAIVFSYCNLSAQPNFVKGFVVDNSLDTIQGFINDQKWLVNPKVIEFRLSESGTVKTYYPWQIKAFSVDNELYFGRIVRLDKSPIQFDALLAENKPVFDTDTLFLSALVLGKASLYYVRDEAQKQHYLIEKDSVVLEELIYRKYLSSDEKSSSAVVINKKYKGQLAYHFSDCVRLAGSTKRLKYNDKHLVKIFRQYNECTGGGNNFIKKQEKLRWEVFALAGITITSLDFRNNAAEFLDNVDFSTSIQPALGIGFSIVFPRNRGKWAIYSDLMYRSFDVSSSYIDDYFTPDYYKIRLLRFDNAYLKLSNFLRYQHKKGAFEPFVNIGLTNAFAIKIENSDTRITYDSGNETTTFISPVFSETLFRRHEQGIAAGIGGAYRKFSLELRFEKSNGMSSYSTLKSTLTTFYVLAGYRF